MSNARASPLTSTSGLTIDEAIDASTDKESISASESQKQVVERGNI